MKQEISTVGIDLAKKIFRLVGVDTSGKILWRKRLTRNALMPFMAQLPPVLIGIEACGGAHYWARRFREHGHDVKLLAPQFVKPFVKSNKKDMRDAEAIAEAVTRPTMRFVPIKKVAQQDIQALHRVRERLIGARMALINEVHGLMQEYGIVMPKGVAKLQDRHFKRTFLPTPPASPQRAARVAGGQAGALRAGGQVAWSGRQGGHAVGGTGRLICLYSDDE